MRDIGKIRINRSKVATGKLNKRLTILHVPTDRFVVVHETGEKLWKKLESGTDDLARLIDEHAKEHGVERHVAAYEVITFFEELRDLGVVSFQLPRERETAPLLDTPLGPGDLRGEHLGRLIAGERPFDTERVRDDVRFLDEPKPQLALTKIAGQAKRGAPDAPPSNGSRVAVIVDPRASLTVGELERLVRGPESEIDGVHLLVLRGAAPDLTLAEAQALATLDKKALPAADRRGHTSLITQPRRDLSVGAIEQLGVVRAQSTEAVAYLHRKVIAIIIIIWEPGPSSGKSRQACKTMCR